MRDFVVLYINGSRRVLRGRDTLLPLSRYLRERERLTGTKVACGEGACGACTILLGSPIADGNALHYETVNACLFAVYQADGRAVVTVEGITPEGALSPVQEAVVACHGTQCGFCTPGVVLTLTAARERQQPGEAIPDATLTGNICRCTGYLGIRAAAEQVAAIPNVDYVSLNHRYPPEAILADLAEATRSPFCIEIADKDPAQDEATHTVFAPTTLEEATAFLARHPEAVLIGGATEIAVEVVMGKRTPPAMLVWLGRIPELGTLQREGETVWLGGGAIWSQVEAFAAEAFPALADLLRRFAGPQIKNVGTVAGNIVYGSPVSDSLPFLLALGARAEIAGVDGGRRETDIDGLTLAKGEILARVAVPLPASHQTLRFYKVSRRRGFDRSVASAALQIGRADDGTITDARIAMGGIGPRVRRLPETEAFLLNKPFTEETFRSAGQIAAGEVAPPSPEGNTSAGTVYRRQLSANLIMKFFVEEAESDRRDGV